MFYLASKLFGGAGLSMHLCLLCHMTGGSERVVCASLI